MDILMLQDWHGVQESVDRQLKLLTEYAFDPESTTILHEPLLVEREHFLQSLPEDKTIEQVWPFLHMEEYWGPSDPYKQFYKTTREQGYDVRSLGDTLLPGATNPNPIDKLAKDFQKLLNDYMSRSADLSYLSYQFDSLKRRISLQREEYFCKRVDNMKYEPSTEQIVFVAHPAHLDRCASYLGNTQNYRVQIADLDSDLKQKLGSIETQIQTEFANEHNILSMESPPLVPIVPIVEVAWQKLMKIESELNDEKKKLIKTN